MSEQASFTAGNALSRKHDKACLNSCFITSDISTTLLSYNFSPTLLSIHFYSRDSIFFKEAIIKVLLLYVFYYLFLRNVTRLLDITLVRKALVSWSSEAAGAPPPFEATI